MVNPTLTVVTHRTARLRLVVALWWAVSVAFSLLLLQPFEALLREQSATAGLTAFDPFVLLVTVSRQQPTLASALGLAAMLVIASKLCAQIPHALALVLLVDEPAGTTGPGTRLRTTALRTTLRTLKALPYVTLLSLLGDGIPIALLYVAVRATGGFDAWLEAPVGTLTLFISIAVVVCGGWLFCLALFDFARIAVVTTRKRVSVWQYVCDGARVLWNAPFGLFWRSSVARAAGFACVTFSLAYSLSLAQAGTTRAAWLAWFVTQAGVVLGLCCRVAWLATATKHAQSLRPPSRNN